jgi:ElaA protein
MNSKLEWNLKKFRDLDVEELYQLLRLRSEVFVVEQRSIFLDLDNKDQHCWHLLGSLNGKLLAYSRLVPAGRSYLYPAIGRIVVSPDARGENLGRELMKVSIGKSEELFGKGTIRIGAQQYLKDFYNAFGFEQTSPSYNEDGIEHIEMTRDVGKSGEH